jgi:hypothetical protein
MKKERIGSRTVSGAFFNVIMMVWLLLAAAPLFIMADVPDWVWDLRPHSGHPQFLAFCPRLLNRNSETLECLRRASEQASKYMGVRVRAKRLYEKKSLFTKYRSWVRVDFSEGLAEELQKNIDVVREYRDDRGTFLLVRLATERMHQQADRFSLPADYAGWVEGGLEIPGYRVAVGAAKRRRLISDSMESADRNALVELALQISSEIESELADTVESEHTGFGYETVDEELSGFYILARAKSEDGRYYYSLAVCPKAANP